MAQQIRPVRGIPSSMNNAYGQASTIFDRAMGTFSDLADRQIQEQTQEAITPLLNIKDSPEALREARSDIQSQNDYVDPTMLNEAFNEQMRVATEGQRYNQEQERQKEIDAFNRAFKTSQMGNDGQRTQLAADRLALSKQQHEDEIRLLKEEKERKRILNDRYLAMLGNDNNAQAQQGTPSSSSVSPLDQRLNAFINSSGQQLQDVQREFGGMLNQGNVPSQQQPQQQVIGQPQAEPSRDDSVSTTDVLLNGIYPQQSNVDQNTPPVEQQEIQEHISRIKSRNPNLSDEQVMEMAMQAQEKGNIFNRMGNAVLDRTRDSLESTGRIIGSGVDAVSDLYYGYDVSEEQGQSQSYDPKTDLTKSFQPFLSNREMKNVDTVQAEESNDIVRNAFTKATTSLAQNRSSQQQYRDQLEESIYNSLLAQKRQELSFKDNIGPADIVKARKSAEDEAEDFVDDYIKNDPNHMRLVSQEKVLEDRLGYLEGRSGKDRTKTRNKLSTELNKNENALIDSGMLSLHSVDKRQYQDNVKPLFEGLVDMGILTEASISNIFKDEDQKKIMKNLTSILGNELRSPYGQSLPVELQNSLNEVQSYLRSNDYEIYSDVPKLEQIINNLNSVRQQ